MSKTKFSKVLDLVFERTTLLYCKNYSFWKNACPSHLTDEISTGLEKELFTGMILVDLQMVFGINYYLVIQTKTKYLGF